LLFVGCCQLLRFCFTAHTFHELRHDSLTKAHSLSAVNTKEFYEPKVIAGDNDSDLMNAKRIADEAMTPPLDPPSSTEQVARRLATDTNDILDLFIVWSPEAEAVAGSANAMSLYIQLAVDEANYVLENSQVELRLRIKTAMRTIDGSYTEPGGSLSNILEQATKYGASDIDFDDEQAMRYTEQADALVIIAGAVTGGQCGVAWLKSEFCSVCSVLFYSVAQLFAFLFFALK
jgi:hypothetical protein